MAGTMPDLSPFFSRYEAHVREADALFERIRSQYPALVVCRERCSSCCHALFDLSLVEALYLNAKFLERFPAGAERTAVLDAADKADRQTVKFKRRIFKDSQAGRDSNEILAEVAAFAVRCPLLGDDDRCLMYEFRPITCRLYGVPTAIGGKAHTCGMTGFKQGEAYPTVALDKMQHRLSDINSEMTAFMGTAYRELASMYVPVSSALLTEYTPQYLGIGGLPKEEKD
jgi:Uncharacterised protein family (UPF0153).